MKKVYICSPYRANSMEELEKNKEYARVLTRKALEAGLAPITPHLYMTQCLDESKEEQRVAGISAGLELLHGCDFIIVGTKYGISDGMRAEIKEAEYYAKNIVDADKLHDYLEDRVEIESRFFNDLTRSKEKWSISGIEL